MVTVEELAHAIVAPEGGYVNDPDDPGGHETRGDHRHDAQPGAGPDRRRACRRAGCAAPPCRAAISVFPAQSFRRPRIEVMPDPLHSSVFDVNVNELGNTS